MPSEGNARQFGVFVKSNLFEDKHRLAMGEAWWLYGWMLDRVTKVDGDTGYVFGGAPITHAKVCEQYGTMSRRNYQRNLSRLKKEGYINIKQVMRGVVITITKSYKVFGNTVSNVAQHDDKSGTAEPHAVTDVAHRNDKCGTAIRQDNRQDNNTKNIYKKELPGFIEKFNELSGKHFKAMTDTMTGNFCAWRETYSLEEILTAVALALEDDWWKDKITPEKFLRRDKDWIGDFLNRKPKKSNGMKGWM